MKKSKKTLNQRREIKDYDSEDVTAWIKKDKPLSFKNIGVELPPTPPTQVISIRLPSLLLNEIRSLSSQRDIPYQSLIKLFLAESVRKMK